MPLFAVEEHAVKISSGEEALLDRGLCVLVWKMCVCGTTQLAMLMEAFH